MDIGKAFGFVFEDEEWIKKLLLGALITLIPIFGQFALMGYIVAIIRNVLAGSYRPLPEWENLGEYFKDGLMVWIAGLVYSLPLILLSCFIALPYLLPALAGNNEDLMGALLGVSTVLSIIVGCIMALYGLLMSLINPIVQLRYAVYGELGPCLRIGEVLRETFGNIGNLLLVMLAIIGGSFVGGLVVSIASITIIGSLLSLPLGVWIGALTGHLIGQLGVKMGLGTTSV
jgi:hypothetical protein